MTRDLAFHQKLEIVRSFFSENNSELIEDDSLDYVKHISFHQDYLNKAFDRNYSFSGAIHSWYENIYALCIFYSKQLRYQLLLNRSDIYSLIFDRIHILKAKNADTTIKEAILDYFDELEKKSWLQKFIRRFI